MPNFMVHMQGSVQNDLSGGGGEPQDNSNKDKVWTVIATEGSISTPYEPQKDDYMLSRSMVTFYYTYWLKSPMTQLLSTFPE